MLIFCLIRGTLSCILTKLTLNLRTASAAMRRKKLICALTRLRQVRTHILAEKTPLHFS